MTQNLEQPNPNRIVPSRATGGTQEQTYTLTCSRCENWYISKEGFPVEQLCPDCRTQDKLIKMVARNTAFGIKVLALVRASLPERRTICLDGIGFLTSIKHCDKCGQNHPVIDGPCPKDPRLLTDTEREPMLVDRIANMIRVANNRVAAGKLAEDILAKTEPLVRADEREKTLREVGRIIHALESFGQLNIRDFPLVQALVDSLDKGHLPELKQE